MLDQRERRPLTELLDELLDDRTRALDTRAHPAVLEIHHEAFQPEIRYASSPTGTTMRPPSASCWKSGGGIDGPPAVTRIRSKGASSGQPSVPLPTRTQTLSWPSCSRRARARSARRGNRSIEHTRRASSASTAV